MNVRIQAIHFEIAERLTEFINKKAARLSRHYPDIIDFDVRLQVIKPETVMNKEATIRITLPGVQEAVTKKIADSFEEAVDLSIEALDKQLEKIKDKK